MSDPILVANLPPPLSRAELLRELAPYAKPSNAKGLKLFVQEYLMYWGAIALIVFAPWMSVKILASLFAGLKLASFYILGHDAGHRILVADKRLNWWLAQLFSIPAWQNHRLWILDHHLLHHPKTNGEQHDFYKPYSKAEFDRLSWFQQMVERVVRAPNVIGFGLNFLFRWLLTTRLVPTRDTPRRHLSSAWRHFAALAAYQVAFVAFLCYAPYFASITLQNALVLGFALPFCLYSIVTGGALYLMHTHARLPWFKGSIERKGDFAPELCAMHMTLPDAVHKLIHNVFAHSVHHAHHGIPPYYLLDAQKHFDKLLGDRCLVEPMTVRGAIATLNMCKLYDYEKHQWLDFDGNPTSEPIRLDARGA